MKRILLLLLLASSLCLSQTATKGKISINDPWIRPAAAGANTGLFFEVVNNTDKPDTLLDAKSSLSTIVELHETYKRSEGVMGMRAVKKVAIPAKGAVKFKPRDLHVMLIELKKDLKAGNTGEIKLRFKNAGIVRIKAVVRDMPKMN